MMMAIQLLNSDFVPEVRLNWSRSVLYFFLLALLVSPLTKSAGALNHPVTFDVSAVSPKL